MNWDSFFSRLQSLIDYEGEYSWMIEVLVILLVTALLSVGVSILLKLLERQLQRTNVWWDDILLHASRKPVKTAVWIFGIFYAVQIIGRESKNERFNDITQMRDLGLVIVFAWACNRFISLGEDQYVASRQRRNQKIDLTAVEAIGKIIKIAINITAILVALQNLGVSLGGLLAFGGIGGIAVGFASKDMLANFFGGLMIYFDKPFKVGDWVRSPDKEIEGTVERVGWRLTTIRTPDRRPLYVPNGIFATISLENPSRMLNRRIKEYISVRLEDLPKIEAITRDISKMLHDHHEIDENQTMVVNFDQIKDSTCQILVQCLTYTTDLMIFHQVKQDVLLKAAAIIAGHGAEVVYPTTRTLHIGEVPPGEMV